MSLPDVAVTAFAVVFIGALIGAVGIGGVLLTPWLTHVVGLPVRDAIVISSFAFIGTGVAALIMLSRSVRGTGSVDWRVILATAPGALLGAWALDVIPQQLALAMLAALTILVGLKAWLPRSPDHPDQEPPTYAPGAPIGVLTGFASALTGTGGPLVLVPMLVWRGTPMREAILLGQAVQLPIALMATFGNLVLGGVDVIAGTTIGLLLIPAALLGYRYAAFLPLVALVRLVGTLLIAAGVAFAFKAAA